MTARPKPPVPGLTATPNGVIHDVYSTARMTWYVTATEQRNIERRSNRRGTTFTDEQIIRQGGPIRPASAPLGITRKQTIEPRQCPQCGDTFGPRTAAQVYCTNSCYRKHTRRKSA